MKVLLVVIDGAAPRVVCPAIRTGRLPNLSRLADAGEMHQECVTIFPSITPAATTSIVTGAYPYDHGIAGASWFDEHRGEVAYYGDDFWVIAKEGFGVFLRDFLVRLNGDRLTAPTLFELIERTGRNAACLNYVVHRGLVTHDVKVPWSLALLPGVPVTETVLGPRVMCLGDFVQGLGPLKKHHVPGASLIHRFGMDDDATAGLLERLAGVGLPDFTVAYFADNDYRSHEVGPFPALPVIERVDRALGSMFDAGGGFDRFMQDTCVIVTSDHGHCEVLADREAATIDLQRLLADFRQAGLGGAWSDRDEIMICPNMRAADIYLRQPTPVMVDRVSRALLRERRIDLVIRKGESIGVDGACYVVLGHRGRLAFTRGSHLPQRGRDAWGTTWSWRGDLATLQLQRDGSAIESTEYPNAFERLAGVLDLKHSGDIWITAQPGCEFNVEGGNVHCGGSSHGGLHALESLCPVILANAPRRLPRAIRSVDVAPLCMELLGLDMRYRVGDPRVGEPAMVGPR